MELKDKALRENYAGGCNKKWWRYVRKIPCNNKINAYYYTDAEGKFLTCSWEKGLRQSCAEGLKGKK